MGQLAKIAKNVLEGDSEAVEELVQKEIEGGTEAEEILNEGLVKGMDQVATQFRDGYMFIPEVLMSAKAMQAGNDLLKPLLVQADVQRKAKIVIGTVEGDLHDIGKKIVGMMLEGAGFEVVDLGMDVSVDRFIGGLKETKAKLVGMSAMLTTTMPIMQKVAERLKEEKMDDIEIMIGGAPVTDDFASQIGAHYSFDAASAVELANSLVG